MERYLWLPVTFAVLALIYALGRIILGQIANGLVTTLSVPHRQKQPETPGDYGLKYDNIDIKTEDSITIKGWHVKGRGEKVAIFSHPGSFTKWGWNINDLGPGRNDTSYGKDVKFLPFIKNLVDDGYDVIMYDQRDHGASDASPFGKHDVIKDAHKDVVAAVEYTMGQQSLKDLPKALVLFCQSSFSGMVAMNKYPDVFKKANVKAYVANQPTDLEDFYTAFGVPSIILNAIKGAYRRAGLTPIEDNDPIKWTQSLFLPTLLIQNTKDPWTNLDHIRDIYKSIPVEKEGYFVDMEPHRFAAYNYFNDDPKPIVNFLKKYID